MKYVVAPEASPKDRDADPKYYLVSKNQGKINLYELAADIAGRSSLTRGDIENCLSNFLDQLPNYLKKGYSVQMGDFGTLRLSLSSTGSDSPEDVSVANLKKVKIIFTPSSKLKKEIETTPLEKL
ncbi:MAG: HU family DNA-binding protein [Bacteroidales bacterium]|nr:HU family DNA-binding protein [Bacteroidales bacterium]